MASVGWLLQKSGRTNLALKAVKTQNDLGGLIARGDPESALPASLPISQSFLVCLFLHSGKS